MTDKDAVRAQYEKAENRHAGAAEERKVADLADTLYTYIEAINDGEYNRNLSIRDEKIAALIYAMEAEGNEKLKADICGRVQGEYGTQVEENPEDLTRSDFIRLLLRIGLNHAIPEAIPAANEATIRRTKNRL